MERDHWPTTGRFGRPFSKPTRRLICDVIVRKGERTEMTGYASRRTGGDGLNVSYEAEAIYQLSESATRSINNSRWHRPFWISVDMNEATEITEDAEKVPVA